MGARLRSLLIGGLSVAAALSPAAAQDPAGAPRGEHLAAALALAPADAAYVGFTDWTAMKAAHDLGFIDSSIPEEVRVAAMIEVTQDEAAFAGEVTQHFLGHAEAWGWDASDLDWEASFSGAGAPVAVLHFRDTLDLAPFIGHFDERGFETREYAGVTIREHEFDVSADWFGTTSIAIVNTALLHDGSTIVMSGSPEALEAVLDVAADPGIGLLASDAAVEQVTGLGEPMSVAIEIGGVSCAGYAPFDEVAAAPDAALLDEIGPLGAWDALSLATYRTADGGGAATLTLSLPGSDLDAERAARERLAREGHSYRAGAPYAETAFEVTGSAAGDGVVSLQLTPVEDRNAVFLASVFARDLLPAMCA